MRKEFQKKSAFTLLELAAVLVIIGTIILGISKGLGMVEASRLNGARSQTIKSAVNEVEGLIGWWETSLKESFEASESLTSQQIGNWHSIDSHSIIDQSNSLTTTASSAITYEEDGINNLPSINFDGTSTLSIDDLTNGDFDQATIFLVVRPTTIGTPSTIFDSADSNKAIAIDSDQIGLESSGSFVYTGTTTNSASFTTGNNYIITAYFNGSSSKAYLNDAQSTTGGANLTITKTATSGISIGASSFNGLVSEVIIYNRPLKLQERIDVTRYLAKKYDITATGI
jgi:type II secretory pathway pseudopilin PulG